MKISKMNDEQLAEHYRINAFHQGRQEQRKKDADERRAAYAKLNIEQRIAKAEAAPGNSAKELAKLRVQQAEKK